GAETQTLNYEQMGRIQSIQSVITTPNGTQNLKGSYTYNLDGTPDIVRFYTGTSYEYTYDAGGRQTGANYTSGSNTYPYVSGAGYDPAQHVVALTQGGGTSGTAAITTANSFDARLQPGVISASGPSATIFSHSFCYVNCYSGAPSANNGNIQTD